MDKIFIGKSGENIAVNYLKQNGYKIIETNWRSGHLEIDIIAIKGDYIIFCEVKTRKTAVRYNLQINREKEHNIIEAADKYIQEKEIDKNVRFDVILINLQNKKIKHIKNAFLPEF